jgi:hypothetical protein
LFGGEGDNIAVTADGFINRKTQNNRTLGG